MLLFFSGSVFLSYSENQDSTKTILWEIKGEGIKNPSYLFATIRVQDKSIKQFDSIAEQKILECNAFALEVIVDLVPPAVLRSLVLMQNNNLEKILTKEDFSFVQKKYKLYTGLSLGAFSKMKPFFLYAQLMKYEFPKDYKESFDTQLLAFAKKNKKRIIELEEFNNQVKSIDKIPLQTQAHMLLFGLKNPNLIKKNFEDVLDAYLQKDMNTVFKLTTDTTLIPSQFIECFFSERNEKICNNIIMNIKQQSTFIVLAAANLMGEKGVFQLLRSKGYSIKPIPISYSSALK